MSEPEVVAYLNEVRSLIKAGWAKGAAARNKAGRLVNWSCDAATNFCLVGAMYRASDKQNTFTLDEYIEAKKLIKLHLNQECLAKWNDSCTDKRQVLRMLDQVIRGQAGLARRAC